MAFISSGAYESWELMIYTRFDYTSPQSRNKRANSAYFILPNLLSYFVTYNGVELWGL